MLFFRFNNGLEWGKLKTWRCIVVFDVMYALSCTGATKGHARKTHQPPFSLFFTFYEKPTQECVWDESWSFLWNATPGVIWLCAFEKTSFTFHLDCKSQANTFCASNAIIDNNPSQICLFTKLHYIFFLSFNWTGFNVRLLSLVFTPPLKPTRVWQSSIVAERNCTKILQLILLSA